jgi:hypothetical protein
MDCGYCTPVMCIWLCYPHEKHIISVCYPSYGRGRQYPYIGELYALMGDGGGILALGLGLDGGDMDDLCVAVK